MYSKKIGFNLIFALPFLVMALIASMIGVTSLNNTAKEQTLNVSEVQGIVSSEKIEKEKTPVLSDGETGLDIQLLESAVLYSGSPTTITATVTSGSATLIKGTDYDLYCYTSSNYTTYIVNNFETEKTGGFTHKISGNLVNAGTYYVVAVGKGNYTGWKAAQFTINKLSIASATVNLSANSLTYNGTEQKPTVSSVVINGLTVPAGDYSTTYTGDFTNVTDTAKTVTVAITNSSSNFTGEASASFSITAFNISTATATISETYTYNNSPKTPVPTVKVKLDGVNDTTLTNGTHYGLTHTNNTNAGTATVTITPTNTAGYGKNYTGEKTVQFTINARSIADSGVSVPASLCEKIYKGSAWELDGSDFGNQITYSNGSSTKTLVYDTDYEIKSCTNNTNAGTAATVTIKGKGNFDSNTERTINFTIKAKQLSASFITTNTPTYTGSAITVDSGLNLTVEDTDRHVTLSRTGATPDYTIVSYANNTNAGTEATITIKGAGNYDSEVSVQKTFTIDPKSITDATVTLQNSSAEYDGTSKIGAWGTINVSLASYSGITYDTSCNPSEIINAGSYTVTLTGTGNYKDTATATFTITPLNLANYTNANKIFTLTAPTYNGLQQTPTFTFKVNNGTRNVEFGASDASSCPYTTSYGTNINAGTDAGSVTITGKTNSNLTGTATYNFTINAKEITSDMITFSADSATYNAKDQTPTVTVSFNNGTNTVTLTQGSDKDYTFSWTGDGRINAGSYTVTVEAVGSNYTSNATKTFTIDKKEINTTDMALTLAKASGTDYALESGIYKIGYDGTDQRPVVSLSFDNGTSNISLESGATKDFTYTITKGAGSDLSGNAITAVGTYTVTITAVASSNYKDASSKASVQFQVYERTITSGMITAPSNVTYNGQSQQQKPVVKDGSVTLTEGEDYTLSWSSDTTNAGTVTVTVTGAGNYQGSANTTYTILTADLSGAVIATINGWTYDSTAYTFNSEVTFNGVAVPNTSYTVSYKRCNVSWSDTTDTTSAGKIKVILTAKENTNFTTGTTKESNEITISARSIEDGDVSSSGAISAQTYTGSQITPEEEASGLSLTYKSVVLVSGVDYTVTYGANTDVSTGGTVVLNGQGNYAGTKTFNFTISPKALSGNVTYTVSQAIYKGSNYTLGTDGGLTLTIHDTVRNVNLDADDWKVDATAGNGGYANNKNACLSTDTNAPTIYVVGQGNYTGDLTVNFTIEQKSISGGTIGNWTNSFEFNNASQVPAFNVSVTGISGTLTSGTDYTVTYQRKNAGDEWSGTTNTIDIGTIQVTITGSVNYKDSITKTYTITPKTITSSMIGTLSNVTYNGSDQTPTVIVSFGTVTLTVDTDYSVAWTGSSRTNAGTYTVTITAVSANYADASPKASATFTIERKSIADVTFSTIGDQTYTRSDIFPEPTVTDGSLGNLTKTTDFTYVYDTTNKNYINVGTGLTVKVTGNGNYTGTSTNSATFNIVAKRLTDGITIDDIADITFNRVAHQVAPTVKWGTYTITQSGNYSVAYQRYVDGSWETESGYINAGQIKIIVSGQGNYTESIEKTYNIVPAVIDSVTLASATSEYNCSAKTITISAVKSGTLALNSDEYTIAYYRGSTQTEDYTNAGDIKVVISSNSDNFANASIKANVTYTITPKSIQSNDISIKYYFVSSLSDATSYVDENGAVSATKVYMEEGQIYRGQLLEAEVIYYTDTNGNNKYDAGTDTIVETLLKGADKDYTYSFTASDGYVEASSAVSLTITGKGNYKETKTRNYTVAPVQFIPENFTITITPKTYTGLPILLTASDITIHDKANNVDLVMGEDKDFVFATGTFTIGTEEYTTATGFMNNTDAGDEHSDNRPSVFFKGLGNYSTTYMCVYFTINPKPINSDGAYASEFSFAIASDSITYTTTENKPTLSTAKYTLPDPDYNMISGQDYSITYARTSGEGGANNFTNVGAFTITIEGTGNFTGTRTLTYSITAKDIDGTTITGIPSSVKYNGATQRPTISATYNSETATFTTKYYTTYKGVGDEDNVEISEDSAFVLPQTIKVVLTGTGNYTGTSVKDFTITPLAINNMQLKIGGNEKYSVVFNKDDQTPTIKVFDENNADISSLAGTKFDVTYEQWNGTAYASTDTPNFTDVGKVKVTITAKDGQGYSGTLYKEFEITAKSITELDITWSPVARTYNGSAQLLNRDGSNKLTELTIKFGETSLNETTDFTISYSADKTSAGDVTVTITGAVNYAGTTTKTYTISKKALSTTKVADAGLSNKTYSGSKIELIGDDFSGIFKLNGNNLIYGTDYEIDEAQGDEDGYANNKNAGTATVYLKGLGNYDGPQTLTFTINKLDIGTNEQLEISTIADQTYTGSVITPTPTVIYKGMSPEYTFIAGTDFDFSYANHTNVTWDGTTESAGASVTITIKNTCANYTGTKTINFKILAVDFATSISIANVADQPYTGSVITPEPAVTWGSITLEEGTHFTYDYEDNTDYGTATIKVVAVANTNYKGEKSITFGIGVTSITNTTISGLSDQTYDRLSHQLEPVVKIDSRTFTKDTDYTITYYKTYDAEHLDQGIASSEDFINVGTITILISAKATGGTLTGSRTETYSITARPLTNDDVTFGNVADQQYTGSDITFSTMTMTVTTLPTAVNNYALQSDDYQSIAYANNKNVGTATITITLKGNYSGTLTKTFAITKKALETSMINGIENKEYTGTSQQLVPTIVYNGITYSVEDEIPQFTVAYYTTYDADNALNNVEATAGDFINAGTLTVVITAKSDVNFSGTIATTYNITRKTVSDLSGFTVLINGQGTYSAVYNGSEQEPTITLTPTSPTGSSALTLDTDYTVSYSSNKNVGTATITVTFIKNYDGVGTTTFTITALSIADANVLLASIANETYSDLEYRKAPSLTYNSVALVAGSDKDYTVKYYRNYNSTNPSANSETTDFKTAGIITILIEGKGNFKDSRTTTYEIEKKNLNDVVIAYETIYTYTGAQITPKVIIKFNNGTNDVILSQGTSATTDPKDYLLVYGENINAGTKAGSVTISAVNNQVNYTGSKTFSFDINKKNLSDCTIQVSGLRYTGSGQTLPKSNITITHDSITLSGNDCNKYSIRAQDPYSYVGDGSQIVYVKRVKDIKTYTVYLVADGVNYKGEASQIFDVSESEITRNVYIVWSGLNKGDVASVVYTGQALTPGFEVRWISDDTILDSTKYSKNYYQNINVSDTAPYVRISGQNGFIGDATFSFKIAQRDIGNNELSPAIIFNPITAQTYNGGTHELSLTGYIGSKQLVYGTDYTVEYSNNINAGTNTAIATITGINNFTGTRTLNFTINPCEITSMGLSIANGIYNGESWKDYIGVNVYVNGSEIVNTSEITNYTIAYYTTYDAVNSDNNVIATNDDFKNVGKLYVVATGAGNYTGSKSSEFNITAKDLATNIAITPNQLPEMAYTGSEIKPDIALTFNRTPIFISNITAGSFAIGTELYHFNSGMTKILDANEGEVADITNYEFTLNSITYRIDNVNNKLNKVLTPLTLSKGTDYTISYTDITDVGTAKISISGTGNYYGAKELTFNIIKAAPDVRVLYDGESGLKNQYFDNGDLPVLTLDTGSTPGTISWKAEYNGKLSKNTQTYIWKFTPADTTNYLTKTVTETLNVYEVRIESVTLGGTFAEDGIYTAYDTMSVAGFVVNINYNDGHVEHLTSDQCEFYIDGNMFTVKTLEVTDTSRLRIQIKGSVDEDKQWHGYKEIGFTVNPIHLTINFDENRTFVEKLTKQTITNYTITGALDNYDPQVTLIYTNKLTNVEDNGFTTYGEYDVKAYVGNRNYVIDEPNSITIIVKQGVINGQDVNGNKIIVVNEKGFDVDNGEALVVTISEADVSNYDEYAKELNRKIAKAFKVSILINGVTPYTLDEEESLTIMITTIASLMADSSLTIYYEQGTTLIEKDKVISDDCIIINDATTGLFMFIVDKNDALAAWVYIAIAGGGAVITIITIFAIRQVRRGNVRNITKRS